VRRDVQHGGRGVISRGLDDRAAGRPTAARDGRPAFGSRPLATVVQDLLSILVYFATVSLLVT
jgi:hypothetical protein